MARLPQPGQDGGVWGTILNEFLGVSHNGDGTLKPIADSNISTVAQPKVTQTVVVKSSNYGVTTSDEIVLANAASGGLTITLPTAASNTNVYHIKKMDTSSNFVTIATTASQLIDGSATAVIKVPFVSLTVVSNGTGWSII